ncbi:RND family transporter [Mycolicibacter virginiensis]|uniref:MMPL/RND family transporter n=1 Tax=Mycolicibacter virginiensis TaxID=1795032 RepID=UPI00061A9C02|nr:MULTISPECIES: MMPL family transporter [Mycobacteriaceae]ULP47461.1 MMPL family transporter [Mycolicibacter virginiensis]
MSTSTHNFPPESPTEVIPAVADHAKPGRIAKWIRRLAIPIMLGWIAIIVLANVTVPQLEKVAEMAAVQMTPDEAPSMIAVKRQGEVFKEFTSNSSVMLVLEGDEPLGADAHHYYDQIIDKLKADTTHVEHIQDFWGDRLTAAGAQSPDGKAAYVQIYTAGNQGEALANESVKAVNQVVDSVTAPPGVKAYVTGGAALAADQDKAGTRSMHVIESLTFVVIITMMLAVYRSITTVALALAMVVTGLASARGIVAFLGYHGLIGLSPFATSLLVTLAIAAATDYAIFLIGRYQEARSAGEDREQAYYTMFRSTAHVVLGSGMTIAGATLCLHFTRLPYFQSLGIPLGIGMTVVVITSLTMGSAVIAVAGRFGSLLEPKRANRGRGWRKIGAAVSRWPGPILIAATAAAMVGILALPGYKPGYNDRAYMPADLPANQGFLASDRHFPSARMNPEMLMIETDHDIRNSADFLVIERIAKRVTGVEGVSRVMSITRPQGIPMEHSTFGYMLGMQAVSQDMTRKFNDDRTAEMLAQAEEMQVNIDTMTKMIELMEEMNATMGRMVGKMHLMVGDIEELRDKIANFDDFFRPMRSYFYWEPHCFDIPVCHALRSVFDAMDGVDTMTDNFKQIVPDMDAMAAQLPQMLTLMPPMIQMMKNTKAMMLTMYATQSGLAKQAQEAQGDPAAMGEAFDKARNDDSFYLPPEIFDNAEFQRGMKSFVSPDGHAVRFIVNHEGDPLSAEGIKHIDAIKLAAKEAMKTTPWEGSKIYVGGTAAMFKDMQEGSNYDLMIAGVAALCLIFIIMLVITRAVVAALVIVGTVVVSLGSAFGLSVLLWQNIIGLQVHWMVMAMAVIILLAVGADYNLLLVSRLREEIHAGLHTGMIRAMGGSGSVVTAAGLVFAFTMMTMAISELRVIGQVGTTIGLGLLLDTLIIRSFMTPSIATLLGKWFWWPQVPRLRPKPSPWPAPLQRNPSDELVESSGGAHRGGW